MPAVLGLGLLALTVGPVCRAETPVLFDIHPSGSSVPQGLTALGGWVTFGARDATTGKEMWRTNGSSVEQVEDIYPGSISSTPLVLTAWDGYPYFWANDPSHVGLSLWRTNGTTTGKVWELTARSTGCSSPSVWPCT